MADNGQPIDAAIAEIDDRRIGTPHLPGRMPTDDKPSGGRDRHRVCASPVRTAPIESG